MRKVIAVCVFLASSGCGRANAQATKSEAVPAPKTKIEAFQAKTGSVIIGGFSAIGGVAGDYGSRVDVEAREFTDASTGKKEYGIVIEVKEEGRFERQGRAFVDYDEIDSLLKGIDYIAKIDSTTTKLADFQADYRTKGDLEVSTYSHSGEVKAAVSVGRIGGAQAFLTLGGLQQLRNAVALAKGELDRLRPQA